MANVTNIPAPRVSIVDASGLMSREWYRFFLNLFTLIGSGTSSTTIIDLTTTPSIQEPYFGEIRSEINLYPSSQEMIQQDVLNNFTTLDEELWRTVENKIDTLPIAPSVGTLGYQNSDNVNINGGNISGVTLSFTGVGSSVNAYKSLDESVSSSTTLQDDNSLSVTLDASSTYAFRFYLFINNVGALEGFKCSVNGTVGVTSLKTQISIFDDTTNTLVGFARITSLGSSVGVGLSTGDNYAVIEGTIETSTAGTFLLQWAQNTSGSNNTTVQRNSVLTATRLV